MLCFTLITVPNHDDDVMVMMFLPDDICLALLTSAQSNPTSLGSNFKFQGLQLTPNQMKGSKHTLNRWMMPQMLCLYFFYTYLLACPFQCTWSGLQPLWEVCAINNKLSCFTQHWAVLHLDAHLAKAMTSHTIHRGLQAAVGKKKFRELKDLSRHKNLIMSWILREINTCA